MGTAMSSLYTNQKFLRFPLYKMSITLLIIYFQTVGKVFHYPIVKIIQRADIAKLFYIIAQFFFFLLILLTFKYGI